MIAQAAATSIRRPGAIFFFWFVRLVFAWLIAGPVARAFVSFGVLDHPRGDAVLFEPGGLWLAEAVRLSIRATGSELRGSIVTAGVLGWLALVPLAALMVALVEPRKYPLGLSIGRAIALLPRFTLLAGATWFVQGVLFLGFTLAGVALRRRFAEGSSEPRADLIAFMVIAFGLGVALLVGVLQDLARAGFVTHDLGIVSAIRHAFVLLARKPVPLVGWASISGLVSFALVLLGAVLTGLLDVSRPADVRLVAVATIHQLVIFGGVVARAIWLAIALDTASLIAPIPKSADKSADSDVPADPSLRPAA